MMHASQPAVPTRGPGIEVGELMVKAHEEDFSVQKKFNSAHVPSRPIAWVVVAIIVVGSIVGGVALIVALPWLFYVGAGIIVIGAIIGWATHAMVDTSARVETPARLATASEPTDGR
jgi:hypothetical protein